MMGNVNVTLKNSSTTDVSVVRQKLLAGTLAGAWHELLILSDEGATDAAYYLAASVVMFFTGNQKEAARLVRKAEETDEPWTSKLEVLYGQLLIEGAICKSLMRDTHADLVDEALEKAEQLLASNRQYDQAMATTYIEILDHVATGKSIEALLLHQKMVAAWGESTDTVIQSWKRVFDMAILRLLCRHTSPARRLFNLGHSDGDDNRYEHERYPVKVLLDLLESASAPTKWAAFRIFVLGV